MNKAIWPLGKDNPACICDDNPNINCDVHVNRFPAEKGQDIPFGIFEQVGTSDDEWYDVHTLIEEDIWQYIECIHLTDKAKDYIKQLISEAKIEELLEIPLEPNLLPEYITDRIEALKQGKGK